MAYVVYPGAPWIDYEFQDVLAAEEIRNGGPGFARVVVLEDLARRRYRLPESPTTADRQALDAFLRARGWSRDPFLFEDPKDAARVGVSLGVAIAAQTVFPLTTTGTDEEYRHFPKQASVTLYADGSPVGVASVDTDARTITASSAPGVGKVMTADFTGLRLVRMAAAPVWRGTTVGIFAGVLDLEEVIRE